MASVLLLLLMAALIGPLCLGLLAARARWRPLRWGLFVVAAILPVILSTALWFMERMTAHGGDLFGAQTDGDLGIIIAQFGSVLLLPVSVGMTFLGRALARRKRGSGID